MHTHFFDHVDLLPQDRYVLNGKVTDLAAECQRYEAIIQAHGGIELLIGGVGENGHIAFNEPTSSLSSRTRVTTLTDRTRLANARFFQNHLEAVPTQALTMGMGTILEAREILILGQGYGKADAIQQAIEGPITHLCPISALQLHPHVTIVCDEAATSELKVKTVKYFQETALL
jgi:glucosamine-6-phosphate deaminase